MTLRFGSFLSPSAFALYRATVDWLARRSGVSATLVEGQSFCQFQRGELDGGFICGLPYVDLVDQDASPITLLGAPVLADPRYRGRPIYFSDVVVRRDSRLNSFADLRGRRWSFNDPTSQSGYNVVRYEMQRMGLPDDFFGEVVEAGSHARSLALLLEGRIDASAIDSHVLELAFSQSHALRELLRVVHVIGPSTIQPLVLSTRAPAPLRARLRRALAACTVQTVPALGGWGVSRWTALSDRDYDDIRQMSQWVNHSGSRALQCDVVPLSPWAPAHRDFGQRIGRTTPALVAKAAS